MHSTFINIYIKYSKKVYPITNKFKYIIIKEKPTTDSINPIRNIIILFIVPLQ